MGEISCEERDRLVRQAFPFGDLDNRTWDVGASSTNFMENGIYETTWVDRQTGETVLEDYIVRDGYDGWGKVTICRHRVPDDREGSDG